MKIPTDYIEPSTRASDHKTISKTSQIVNSVPSSVVPNSSSSSTCKKATTEKRLLANLFADGKRAVIDLEKKTVTVDGERTAKYECEMGFLGRTSTFTFTYSGAKILQCTQDGLKSGKVIDLIRKENMGTLSFGFLSNSIYNFWEEKVYTLHVTSLFWYNYVWDIALNDKNVGKIEKNTKSNTIEIDFPSNADYRKKALLVAMAMFSFRAAHPGSFTSPMIMPMGA